jgi:hypothetical protein
MPQTGKVVRAFVLRRVIVFAAGYVGVLAEREFPRGWNTIVRVRVKNCRGGIR